MKKLIITTLLAIVTLSSSAGWEITYRINDTEGTLSYDIMLIDDHLVKYPNNEMEFIIDTETGEMTFILNDQESYWSGNPDDFRSGMNTAMKTIMDEMMAQVPEEQRAMYKEMLGGMAEMYNSPDIEELRSLKIDIENTNEVAEIAGYSAKKYLVKVNDNLMESLWISNDINLGHDYNGRKVYEILSKIRPNIDNEELYEFSDTYLNLMNQGLILKSQDNDSETSEAIKIEKRTISKEEIGIPAGYNKIDISELLQQQMMQSDDTDNENDW